MLAWFPKAYTRGCTGKDGRIQSIDKSVQPATSAEDMAAKLHELGTPMRGQ